MATKRAIVSMCLVLLAAGCAAVHGSSQLKVLWKVPVGPASSIQTFATAVLPDSNTVIVQGPTPDDSTTAIFGVDTASGHKVWTLPSGVGGDGGIVTQADSTTFAVLNISHVTVYDGSAGLLKFKWDAVVPSQSFSAMSEGLLVCGTDAGATQFNEVGFELLSGKQVYNHSKFMLNSMGVIGTCNSGIVFSIFEGPIAVMDPKTTNFTRSLSGGYQNLVTPSLFLSCSPNTSDTSSIQAVRYTDGGTQWTYSMPAGLGMCNQSHTGSPVLSRDGSIAFFATQSPPNLVAVEVLTGTKLWSAPLHTNDPGPTSHYNLWGYLTVTDTFVAVFEITFSQECCQLASVKRMVAYDLLTGSKISLEYFANTLYPQAMPVGGSDGVFLLASVPSTFYRPAQLFKFGLA